MAPATKEKPLRKTKSTEKQVKTAKSTEKLPKASKSSENPIRAATSRDKRPLYELKNRIQLPPRKKVKKIQRWPQINLPPLKRKPWDPLKAAMPKPVPPKPVVQIPPFKRKKWTPPGLPKVPPKPKIDYPPLVPRVKV